MIAGLCKIIEKISFLAAIKQPEIFEDGMQVLQHSPEVYWWSPKGYIDTWRRLQEDLEALLIEEVFNETICTS